MRSTNHNRVPDGSTCVCLLQRPAPPHAPQVPGSAAAQAHQTWSNETTLVKLGPIRQVTENGTGPQPGHSAVFANR